MPRVTVSYSLIRSWDGGFMGHFTITNHGSKPLSGWVVNATLPGDRVESAWGADYRTDGDTLTLTPASYDPVLGPDDSQSAYFTASGSATRPTASSAGGGG
jgi:cellulase/cellobiase CelA1